MLRVDRGKSDAIISVIEDCVVETHKSVTKNPQWVTIASHIHSDKWSCAENRRTSILKKNKIKRSVHSKQYFFTLTQKY